MKPIVDRVFDVVADAGEISKDQIVRRLSRSVADYQVTNALKYLSKKGEIFYNGDTRAWTR